MLKYKEALLYLIFIIVIIVFIGTKTVPKIIEFFNITKDSKEKTLQISELENQLKNLKEFEQKKSEEIVEIKKIYKQDSPNLDAESAFTVLFDDIINMTKYNGVKVYSIQYTYNPPEDEFVKNSNNQYNVCQLDMELVSDYQDFESFLKEVFKYPYLVNVEQIELMAYPKNKKILLIKLRLKLYASK